MKYKVARARKGMANRLNYSARISIWINLEGNCDLWVINLDKFGKDNTITRILYSPQKHGLWRIDLHQAWKPVRQADLGVK